MNVLATENTIITCLQIGVIPETQSLNYKAGGERYVPRLSLNNPQKMCAHLHVTNVGISHLIIPTVVFLRPAG